jgi:hypothetical protein
MCGPAPLSMRPLCHSESGVSPLRRARGRKLGCSPLFFEAPCSSIPDLEAADENFRQYLIDGALVS